MTNDNSESRRLCCPACGRFLCSTDGTYVDCPPCACGVQTTVRIKRTSALTDRRNPATMIETK